MARAKHTGRAEARRRYRLEHSPAVEADDIETTPEDSVPAGSAARPRAKPAQTAPARPGFMAAFRGAYHPANFREDLAQWRVLLRSRALLAGIGLVFAGAIAAFAFPGYTGSAFAWELLVLPGSALAPQLVAGFFAPRASYLLGFVVGLVQGIVFTASLTVFAARLGTPVPADQMTNLLTLSFVTGPISGTLFASASAWYRRFLALSSPRRAQAGRASAKGGAKRATRR